MKDIMLDLESLGTRPGSIILSIGAVAFDRFAGPDDIQLGEEFYTVIDLGEAQEIGLTRDPDTVKWWASQDHDAQHVFAECALCGVSPAQACVGFNEYVTRVAELQGGSPENVQVWGNGSTFDNTLLRAMYAKAGVVPVWSWWNDLCYRTLKGIAAADVGKSIERVGTFHNALDDAKTQAMRAVAMFQSLRQV